MSVLLASGSSVARPADEASCEAGCAFLVETICSCVVMLGFSSENMSKLERTTMTTPLNHASHSNNFPEPLTEGPSRFREILKKLLLSHTYFLAEYQKRSEESGKNVSVHSACI